MSIRLPEIIGLPFQINTNNYTGRKYQDSLPIMTIQPMEPDFNKGVHFLRLVDASSMYQKILRNYGFSVTNKSLKFVFTLEGAITDGASNNFGETHLSHLANTASEPLFEARQILGIKNIKDIQNKVKDIAGIGGMASAGIGKVKSMMDTILGSKASNLISSLALGSKIDMPMIWKNSSSSMDYSVTIRLYNPDPSSETSFEKHIVGPIIAVYALTLPRSDENDETYKWPFYCRAIAPGLFKINMGAIKDLSISKGGNSTSFDYQQRPTIVEIRLTIGELFSTRILTEDGSSSNLFPTLKDYMECSLKKKSSVMPVSLETHYDNGSTIQAHDRTKLFVDRSNLSTRNIRSSSKSIFDPTTDPTTVLDRVLGPRDSAINQSSINKNSISNSQSQIQKSIDRTVTNAQDKEITQSLENEGIEWIDPDLSDDIKPLGENSYIDVKNNNAVVHQLDFKTIKSTISKAKSLIDNGISTVDVLLTSSYSDITKFVDSKTSLISSVSGTVNKISSSSTISGISNKISSVMGLSDKIRILPTSLLSHSGLGNKMKNMYDILTSSADTLDKIVPDKLVLGDNSIVDIKNKSAILHAADFPNKNKLQKHTKDLEKTGYKVNVILT